MLHTRVFRATIVAAALTSLLALSAQAQTVAPRIMVPQAENSQPGGITVTATGSAQGPATDATFTLHVSQRGGALQLNAHTLAPIIDAMVAAGVDRNSIALPPYMTPGGTNTNFATIVGKVNTPTVAMLRDGFTRVGAAVATIPNVIVNDGGVQLGRADCSEIQSHAQTDALLEARKQAAGIAAALGVRVGKPLSVVTNAQPRPYPGGDACASFYSFGASGGPNFTNLADYLQVRVYSNVTITYAIR
ncbi:MAG TPA: SIMPL domain-containing protein [Candidatus Baltobacteraceae bacterium]